jgi:hypothetical protein
MWKIYSGIVRRYPKITLSEERRLILEAQKGSKENKDELVLRHIGFLIFRIRKKVFPHLIQRFAEDLLEEAILIVYTKVKGREPEIKQTLSEPDEIRVSRKDKAVLLFYRLFDKRYLCVLEDFSKSEALL